MDDCVMDTLKAEKMNAMRKFKRTRKVKKFFRYVVVAVSAVLLSWSWSWIPVVLETAVVYFRVACSVVASSAFVFLLCNGIIITLAAKSGQLSAGGGTDLYDEFVKSSENRPKYFVSESFVAEAEEKTDISEEKLTATESEERISSKPNKYERCQSENLSSVERTAQRRCRRLRRSETESHRNNTNKKTNDSEDKSSLIVMEVPPTDYNEMAISNEELTRRFEEFIAKQLSFQRRESLAMVVQGEM